MSSDEHDDSPPDRPDQEGGQNGPRADLDGKAPADQDDKLGAWKAKFINPATPAYEPTPQRRGRGIGKKSRALREWILTDLVANYPRMTVRQIFYEQVARDADQQVLPPQAHEPVFARRTPFSSPPRPSPSPDERGPALREQPGP